MKKINIIFFKKKKSPVSVPTKVVTIEKGSVNHRPWSIAFTLGGKYHLLYKVFRKKAKILFFLQFRT